LNRDYTSETTCPNLNRIVQHSNEIMWWISTEVATTPNLKKRIKTLSHCVLLAGKLKKLKNWNGFMAVVSGLIQYPVARMKNTWKNLPVNLLTKWDKYEKLATPVENFRSLRDAITSSPLPSLLPMTLVLRDLTFINDGNLTWYDEKAGLLNFPKLEFLGRLINQMNERQHVYYPLTACEFIQSYLKNLFIINDLEILEGQSKRIEPTNMVSPV